MKKRQLGAGGPMISAIGLGCMSFAGFFGATDEDTSLSCLDAAHDAGVDFLDTSNLYGMGLSEEVIGKWRKTRGKDAVIATKAGIVPGPPRGFDNSEAYLRGELEKSLKRLGRDHVELYYLHRRDPSIPIAEAVGTLKRFIDEGLIGGYGLSEVSPATLRQAHAEHPCRAVQNEYSLWSRQPELGLIDACAELGVAFIPFSPVARGMLTDVKLDPPNFADRDFRKVNPRFMEPNFSYNEAAIAPFRAYARSRGWSTAAAAIAWVLGRGDHLIPIPGTRSAAHLADWAKADEIVLTDADLAEIARLLPAGFAAGDRYSDNQIVGVERYC